MRFEHRVDALPRTDGGVPIPSALAACLEDIRSQTAAARRSAEDRRDSLRAASKRGDNELAQHDLTVVRVLTGRVRELAAAASRCR